MHRHADAKTYLITWTCYGTWLHGDACGSVDRNHNIPGTPYLDENQERRRAHENRLNHPPYQLENRARAIVLRAIRDVCTYRGWELLAVHVRTNHVYVVVTADVTPERVMNDFKAYASRALNRAGMDDQRERRWTRHGSTRYLNDLKNIEAAIEYVLEQQGERMNSWAVEDEDAPGSSGPA